MNIKNLVFPQLTDKTVKHNVLLGFSILKELSDISSADVLAARITLMQAYWGKLGLPFLGHFLGFLDLVYTFSAPPFTFFISWMRGHSFHFNVSWGMASPFSFVY